MSTTTGLAATGIRARGRTQTWLRSLGPSVVLLALGLSLPVVFGDRSQSVSSGGTATKSQELPPLAGSSTAEPTALPADASAHSSGSDPTATGAGRGSTATAGETTETPAAPDIGDSGVARQATDVGVTADEVKLGFLLLDLGGASRVGFASGGLANAEEQQRILQAYVDEWNDAGGIGGRTIVPVFAKFDPLSDDSKQAACLALAEDAKVFAALDPSSGFNGASVLCFTETYGTPLLSGNGFNNISDEVQTRSGGRLFGLSMRGVRILQNATLAWEKLGALDGKTIGILDWAELGNPQTVDLGLVRTLKDLGYRVKERVILATDPSTAASQVPTAVQQMRTAGVDLIINVTSGLYMAQFSQAADAQQYHPQYVASDWALNGTDFTAQNNSRGYDGTPVVTVFRGNDIGRIPMSEPERRCEDIYRRRIGPPPPRDPGNPNAWVGFVVRCAVVDYAVRGTRAAGPNLTRDTLTGGVQSLGLLEVALFLPGTFRPGKSDLADNYYLEEWRFDCRCHRVVSGPHPAAVT